MFCPTDSFQQFFQLTFQNSLVYSVYVRLDYFFLFLSVYNHIYFCIPRHFVKDAEIISLPVGDPVLIQTDRQPIK